MSPRHHRMQIVVALLFVAGLQGPGDSAPGQQSAKDFTSVDLAKLGVKLVQPAKDPTTGFIVGGKNRTSLLKTLTEINGRTIADLEKDMRPGAASEVGSEKGFLGADERLLDVLQQDNRYVVDELGLSHQELARHLRILAAIGAKIHSEEFLYHGRRFKVTGMDRATAGSQLSPFRDGTRANQDATVHNLENGKKVGYSLLVPQMIERYGFYEGKGTPYRVEPRTVVEVLDFLKAKK